MRKLSVLTVIFFLLSVIGYCNEIDYRNFSSLEEVIDFETSCISSIPFRNFEKLSDAYASRGESFLLSGCFENALKDFQQAYDLALNIQDLNIANPLIFRSLFDQAIVYGYLDMPDKIDILKSALMDVIHSMECFNPESEDVFLHPIRYNNSSIYTLKHKHEHFPFHERDTISIRECVDLVDNTWDVCLLLISFAHPRVESRLTHIINHLASDARKCCLNGERWKGCFKKLGEKFHQWNQKWQQFGIPPDPNWK